MKINKKTGHFSIPHSKMDRISKQNKGNKKGEYLYAKPT
jgi:hypothetical protein